MSDIVLEDVGKVYDGKVRALEGLTLEIDAGEFVVLVGPSGCGKTTALRMVAGLESIEEGVIKIDGRVMNDIPAGRRNLAMVFQTYALYPHMSIFENLAFPLQCAHVPKSEIRQRVSDAAEMLGLTELLGRKPRALSGGQRQRVAMGRAIVRHPEAFLMDEPLSNLDAKLRMQMRGDLSALQRQLGVTTLYVTHDQVEAMTMGDRIAVLSRGRLEQFGSPDEIYNRPASTYVSGFMGSPGMNLFVGNIEADLSGLSCRLGDNAVVLDVSTSARLRSLQGNEVIVGIRPEKLAIAAPGDENGWGWLSGRVRSVEVLGHECLVQVAALGVETVRSNSAENAHSVGVATNADEAIEEHEGSGPVGTFYARTGAESTVKVGEKTRFWFRQNDVHFFDRSTTRHIYSSSAQ